MTLKIRELIIRAEVSDSRAGAGDTGDKDSDVTKDGSLPTSMTDRFIEDDRQNENER